MRRWISIVLVIAVVGIAANDIWRYSRGKTHLSDTTYQLAKYAAEAAPTRDRATVAREIQAMAQPFGVVVYQYAQEGSKAQLWTQTSVSGTIVVGPVMNLLEGMPFEEARKTPFVIREFKQAGI